MKVSQERQDELKELIRIKLIRYPKTSCKKMSEALRIDKDFANKLMNQVRAENTNRIKEDINKLSDKKATEEILQIQSELDEAIAVLWSIAENERNSNNSRIRALNGILNIRRTQFTMKMEAGIFVKKDSGFNMAVLVGMIKENEHKRIFESKDKEEGESSPLP